MPRDDEVCAVMQPYFFPYIGYFSLIAKSDYFVFFDTAQYERRGWMNRNRILHPNVNEDSNYIIVPVEKASRESKINEILISKVSDWRERLFSQLAVYKKIAPYYENVIEVLHESIDCDCQRLSDLTVNTTVAACKYIGIPIRFDVFSRMNLSIEKAEAPDEWALLIVQKLGFKKYINAIGGKEFFDVNKYSSRGVEIGFLEHRLPEYKQRRNRFIPGLSIIDVMMFCAPEEIQAMVDDCEIILSK